MVPRTVLRTGALPDWPTGPACCRSHPDHRRTRWTPNPVARLAWRDTQPLHPPGEP